MHRIIWSDHAIQRARERFGGVESIRVPERCILRATSILKAGDNFFVRTKQCYFALVIRRGGVCLIKTVMYPPHDKRSANPGNDD